MKIDKFDLTCRLLKLNYSYIMLKKKHYNKLICA